MGLWRSFKNFLYPEDDYEEVETTEVPENSESQPVPTRRTPHVENGRNVVPFQTGRKGNSKIFVMEPSVYSEAERIADALLRGEAVIVNFRRMDGREAKRVIDFIVGVAYAVNGDVQKVRDEIFICSPANIQVQGSFDEASEELFRRQEEQY